MKEILKGIRKADEDFHLIDDGDCIVVGVSGGKRQYGSIICTLHLSTIQSQKLQYYCCSYKSWI